MAEKTVWRVLFVDDESDVCDQVREILEGETDVCPDSLLRVETVGDLDSALEMLEAQRFDIVILDVKMGLSGPEQQEEGAGVSILEAIQKRRFVPIIFYTNLPNRVHHLKSSLIHVVEKAEGPGALLAAMRTVFGTRLPLINRALFRLLDDVQREYMWGFVGQHWDELSQNADPATLAHLLARRLGMSLCGPRVEQLIQDLGGGAGLSGKEHVIHPVRYYIIPPLDQSPPQAGDVFCGQVGGSAGYWILLTPSCDLVPGRVKAERVLLAACMALTDQPECKKWQGQLPNPSKTAEDSLAALLTGNRERQPERYCCLPGALSIPDLVVDFQHLTSLDYAQLGTLERVASLDSPFGAAVLVQFARYYGRPGTPDLDVGIVLGRLRLADSSGDS